MRNFRTAAVAAATAVTVAFAGTTVASAAESETSSFPSGSSAIGDWLKADKEVSGDNLLGKETNDANNEATWSLVWRDGTYALIGTAIAGALTAAYNYAVYNHIVPQHILDPIFRR